MSRAQIKIKFIYKGVMVPARFAVWRAHHDTENKMVLATTTSQVLYQEEYSNVEFLGKLIPETCEVCLVNKTIPVS